jgi:hypothetical protein
MDGDETMVGRVLLVLAIEAATMLPAYWALGSVTGGAPALTTLGPAILAIALFFAILMAMRPRRRSFAKRCQDRRWRAKTRARWAGAPVRNYRHFWMPPNWGTQNWLTRSDGKKIVNNPF